MKKLQSIQVLAIACTVAALATLVSCALAVPANRLALVYAVSEYATASDLTLTDDDANSMATLLSSHGWTVQKRVSMDTASGWTKADMQADIQAAASNPGLVLVYYSGHGVLDSQGNAYLCPWDTDLSNQASIAASAVSVPELLGWLHEAGLEHALVILDSCHSGGFALPGSTVDGVPVNLGQAPSDMRYTLFRNAAGDAVDAWLMCAETGSAVVLAAAGSRELSWENPTLGHGVFTYYLLQAASLGDVDRDGWVSSSELYSYTSRAISVLWNAVYPYKEFHPHVSGNPREYAVFKSKP